MRERERGTDFLPPEYLVPGYCSPLSASTSKSTNGPTGTSASTPQQQQQLNERRTLPLTALHPLAASDFKVLHTRSRDILCPSVSSLVLGNLIERYGNYVIRNSYLMAHLLHLSFTISHFLLRRTWIFPSNFPLIATQQNFSPQTRFWSLLINQTIFRYLPICIEFLENISLE